MSSAVTPHASVSFPPTGPVTPAPSAPPPAPTFAPPSTFDVLTDLNKLLKRLLETPIQTAAITPSNAQPAAQSSLETQQVAATAGEIRLKIQKAQRAVLASPEIDRTCEDQEEEIDDLEAYIARLKASLQKLGRPVMKSESEDQMMTE